jgi:hypothetical protein
MDPPEKQMVAYRILLEKAQYEALKRRLRSEGYTYIAHFFREAVRQYLYEKPQQKVTL